MRLAVDFGNNAVITFFITYMAIAVTAMSAWHSMAMYQT